MKKISKLSELVLSFRNAIENAINNNENIFNNSFPAGCCGDASDLLSQFLIDNDIGPIIYENRTYYSNNEDNGKAHTWLIVYNLVVDITGDQFKNLNTPLHNEIPVYIGPKNDFYNIFNYEDGSYHYHNGLNASWSNYHELCDWYRIILKYI